MAGDPYWNNVVLGMHMNDTGLTDVKGHAVTLNGGAARSATQSKFGGYSAYFDGAGDYLSTPDSADWNFGDGDFTIEAFVNFDASNPDYQTIVGQYNTSSNWWFLRKDTGASNKLNAYFRIGGTVKADYIMTSNWSGFSTGTWYHIALVRSGTNLYLFIDGVSQTLTANTAISTNDVGDVASLLYVGSDTTYALKGYIDDLRITKGAARYTANFTPPAAAFPDNYIQVSGTVKDSSGSFAARTVYVHRRSDGALAGTATSNGTTGVFAINALDATEHYAVALPSSGSENALIFDHITPI